MGLVTGALGIGGPDAPQLAEVQGSITDYQAQDAIKASQIGLQKQNQLLAALQDQGGLQNQSNVYNQLQGVVSGSGPNPAQAMLNQATGQNIASQAALMAGQRGASANAGLIARQAAQQGANTQQQAAGQAAVMQANQSLNALGQAGNIATTQAGNQINQTNALAASQQSQQQALLNAIAAQNNARVGNQSSLNSANASISNARTELQGKVIGSAMNAGGAGAKMATGANGGIVEGPGVYGPGYAKGGSVGGPQSHIGQYLANMACGGEAKASGGGLVDVMISPGEKIVPPQEVQKVAQGEKPQMKTVPGQAKVAGDSLKNDTVKAKLPAGTIIVKRSRANNNPEGFIKEVLAKRGKRK